MTEHEERTETYRKLILDMSNAKKETSVPTATDHAVVSIGAYLTALCIVPFIIGAFFGIAWFFVTWFVYALYLAVNSSLHSRTLARRERGQQEPDKDESK